MTETFQFLGIKWVDGVPKFMVARADNTLEYLDIPKKINLIKTDKKRCVGYYDLAQRQYMPCSARVDFSGTDMSQCTKCRDANGFGMCLGCNGDSCRADNPLGRAFCCQEHLVYLAAFPSRFKVGTAAGYRGLKRMYEQGALVSVFFAKTPDGRTARQIEQAVSDLGISKNINTSYKMNNLIFKTDISDVRRELMQKLNEIRPKISENFAQYFIEPQVNIFTDIHQGLFDCIAGTKLADLFGTSEICTKDYRKVSDAIEISGNVKSIVGGLLVTLQDSGLSVINMKNWEGFEIKLEI